MAVYEYQCRSCDTTFEVRRAMDAPADAVTCPDGHADVRRRFSVFAAVGASASSSSAADLGGSPMASGGGCCGGGCGCR